MAAVNERHETEVLAELLHDERVQRVAITRVAEAWNLTVALRHLPLPYVRDFTADRLGVAASRALAWVEDHPRGSARD